MKTLLRPTLFALSVLLSAPALADQAYVQSVQQWRSSVETGLKRDNGWLTLAGRYLMKAGDNTIGTATDGDIVLPPGLGPERLGRIIVDGKMVILKLNDGIVMRGKEGEFKGERVLNVEGGNRDWVSLGRMAFHVIERKGKYILRLADNENPLRKNFPGRVWYDVNENYKVSGKFVPYPEGRTMKIIDVVDEVHDMPSPGYVEFVVNGMAQRLDVAAEPEDTELFVILKDQTAGRGTYNAGRFLVIEWPEAIRKTGGPVTIDFNKTYNPPCAFSDYTTCPLPPEQNQMKVRVEAGEKYLPKKLG